MVNKPVVFISSTSDLRSARELVGKVLYSMGYEPVWQEIEATDGGELLGVLRKRIEPCAMVVQLVGQRYGAEPPTATGDFGRVSYTQYEALYAEKLGRKVIYHFIDAGFPTDAAVSETEEHSKLQAAYRQRIKDANKLRHSNIISAEGLELSIRRISDELAAVRKRGDRRFRKMLWLAGGTSVGIVVIGALLLAVLHGQARLEAEVAAARGPVSASIEPKPLAQGQSVPGPQPADIIAKARLLLEHGNPEDRVVARIALKQSSDVTDRIIQELKSQPGNTNEDQFRLLTLEGDNWYQAGQPDKAINPYEEALKIRPTFIAARNNVMIAHISARLGDIAGHRRRAIEVAEETLKVETLNSDDWAMTQNNLGNAWNTMPTGDKRENLRRAIAAYEAVLTVRTRDGSPIEWAIAENNLGTAWAEMPTGDKGENLRKAIGAYEAALTVRTKDAVPGDWAMTLSNLGIAWGNMPAGDKGENLRKAIATYELALTVQTKEATPTEWANTLTNLGSAWADMPTGDREKNLRKAIGAYESALTVQSREATPIDWAMTQNDLGIAWSGMPTGDKSENLRKAIAAYEAALGVFTRETDPTHWAATEDNLGIVWSNKPDGDRGENLRKAIAAHEAALTISTRDADPTQWARTQHDLGNAWGDLPTGDKGENLRKAIAAYELAVTVLTRETAPTDWAVTQNDLGIAWSDVPTGDKVEKGESLGKAIAAFEAVLTVFTRDADPAQWARIQHDLGNAWGDLPTGDRGENVRKAIAAYEKALTVQTRDAAPTDWAATQMDLGIAWSDLPTGEKGENLGKAIAAYEASLTVFTRDAEPVKWARTKYNLGNAWGDLPTGEREENLGKAIAAYQASLTVFAKDENAGRESLLSLSWDEIVVKDFKGALATAEIAPTLKPEDLPLETNLCTALLFLGRTEEAKAIYLKHVGEKLGDTTWEAAILADFDELEKLGLSNANFPAMRELLKSAKSSGK